MREIWRRSFMFRLPVYVAVAVVLEQVIDLLMHRFVPSLGEIRLHDQVQDAAVIVTIMLLFGLTLLRELVRRTRAEESLRGAVAELQATQRGLEHAVIQRTAELAEANTRLEAKIAEQTVAAAELRRQQAQLNGLLAERSALLDISRSFTTTLELEPLLGLILDQVKPLIDYTVAAVFLQEGDTLIALEHRGPAGSELDRTATPIADAPLYQEILRRRSPVIIADLQSDEPLAQAYRTQAGPLLRSALAASRAFMGVPLIARERVLGVVRFGHATPGYYVDYYHAQLALAVASQAAAAIENARLYAGAQYAAKLEERQRLAREIHDSVSQALYGIVLGARTARKLLARDPGQLGDPLAYISAMAENAITDMRTLIQELRPEGLAEDGLVPALRAQAGTLAAQHGLQVEVEACSEPEAPLEVKAALLRIAQEALYNVTRHAQARHVHVHLRQDAQGMILEVQDDGVGFDPTRAFPGHLGLQSMRERAALLGGTLQIESLPTQGTCVQACVPGAATGLLADLIL